MFEEYSVGDSQISCVFVPNLKTVVVFGGGADVPSVDGMGFPGFTFAGFVVCRALVPHIPSVEVAFCCSRVGHCGGHMPRL